MSKTYEIKTEKFGIVPIVDDGIRNARTRARLMFGVGPSAVSRRRTYIVCEHCVSAPCCCASIDRARMEA